MGKEAGWFKPGNKMGPGRPSLPSELRAERKSNQSAFIRLVSRYLAFTENELLERMAGPEPTQLECIIYGMLNKAKEGDVPSAKYLIETMTGKIPESDEFSEEEIRILRRLKEVMDEQRAITDASGDGNKASSHGADPEQTP